MSETYLTAAAYGEADSRTDKYRASLNNARADLVKMQRELLIVL